MEKVTLPDGKTIEYVNDDWGMSEEEANKRPPIFDEKTQKRVDIEIAEMVDKMLD